jgi:hypothetical protein
MAQDWTARLTLDPSAFEGGLRRVEGAAARTGEGVGRALNLRTLMGGALVLKGVELGITGVNLALRASAISAAAAKGDWEGYINAQLRAYAALDDMIRVVPIVGGAITRLLATARGDEAMQQLTQDLKQAKAASLQATDAFQQLCDTAADLTAELSADPMAVPTRAIEAAKARAREKIAAIEAEMAAHDEARKHAQALGQYEITYAEGIEYFKALNKKEAAEKKFTQISLDLGRKLLNEKYKNADEEMAKFQETKNREVEIAQEIRDRQLRPIQELTAATEREYDRRVDLARQAAEKVLQIEEAAAHQRESWEERWFRLTTKGMAEPERRRATVGMAQQFGQRAETAARTNQFEEARRLLEKQQDYLEQAGMIGAMPRVEARIQEMFRREGELAKKGLGDQVSKIKELQADLDELAKDANLVLKLDADEAFRTLNQLSEKLAGIALKRGVAAPEYGVEAPAPVTVGTVHITFTQAVDRNTVRDVIVPELERLKQRGRT